MIGTGRAAHRQTVLDVGAHYFVDLHHNRLEDIGEVDMVFDVIGGQTLHRSATLVRSGGALVSITEPTPVPTGIARVIFFVVEPDGMELVALERRLRDGRLRPRVGAIYSLEDALAAFDPTRHSRGKTIIRVIDDGDGE